MSSILLKVVNSDLTSPFQEFKFRKGKWYHCANFDTNPGHDCAPPKGKKWWKCWRLWLLEKPRDEQ